MPPTDNVKVMDKIMRAAGGGTAWPLACRKLFDEKKKGKRMFLSDK